ncbi:MAG: N-acetyltransferase family protein [Tepidamorphaceae bacterium]|nr:N-acetyltransferase [Rhodobiaceae bacterium]
MTADKTLALTIRDATHEDLAAITAIYADEVTSGTATFEVVAPDLEEMTARFDALRKDGFPYIVAVSGGEVLGYAYAGPYHKRAAYRFTLEDSIYIAREARGMGVGRKLLQALIAACEDGGWRQMIAIISNSGTGAASIGLHKSLGFSDAGLLRDVGYKSGEWRDITLMQRTLGVGANEPPPEGR